MPVRLDLYSNGHPYGVTLDPHAEIPVAQPVRCIDQDQPVLLCCRFPSQPLCWRQHRKVDILPMFDHVDRTAGSVRHRLTRCPSLTPASTLPGLTSQQLAELSSPTCLQAFAQPPYLGFLYAPAEQWQFRLCKIAIRSTHYCPFQHPTLFHSRGYSVYLCPLDSCFRPLQAWLSMPIYSAPRPQTVHHLQVTSYSPFPASCRQSLRPLAI